MEYSVVIPKEEIETFRKSLIDLQNGDELATITRTLRGMVERQMIDSDNEHYQRLIRMFKAISENDKARSKLIGQLPTDR